jgi:hypothetical protein
LDVKVLATTQSRVLGAVYEGNFGLEDYEIGHDGN